MSEKKEVERRKLDTVGSDLSVQLTQVDAVVFKTYLEQLANFDVVVPDECPLDTLVENICINKLCKLVYDKEEDNLDKLNGVLTALYGTGSALVVMIDSDGKQTDLYFGVRDVHSEVLDTSNDTLLSALKSGFSGIKSETMNEDEVKQMFSFTESRHVASVSGVPSLKDREKKTFVQGLDKIIEGMSGQTYKALLLAEPVSRHQLDQAEAAYHQLYSALTIMGENQITLSENESISIGNSLSKTITESITKTTTVGHNVSHAKTKSPGAALAAVGAGIGATVGAAAGTAVNPGAGTLIGAGAGAGIGGAIGGGIGMAFLGSKTDTDGKNSSVSDAEMKSKGTQKTESMNLTTGKAKSLQFTLKDRRIIEILNLIDEQLERIRVCKNYGMWNWGGYFLSTSLPSVRLGANLYSGILRGDSTGIESSAINVWSRGEGKSREKKTAQEEYFECVLNYLQQCRHPQFKPPLWVGVESVAPSSLVSTAELAVGVSLPRKSVPGIPVMDLVSFGRSVSFVDTNGSVGSIPLGKISHLGKMEENHSVNLDKNSLTAHVFVTGSTGAGKSTTIYGLLDKLKVPFLVIEPAKGEYKNVFGGRKGVQIFGTNPKLTPLLKINPFAFPDGIHVVEHIDRLIDILNAVWPMYAAMPAILKEGVELAYQNMGWDLLTSECCYDEGVFPDFQDLMDVLPNAIKKSDYSDEMKGNYAGALLTRVRSLTNGYFRAIFQKEEIAGEQLFDNPCIVDLSRVGSAETKALLMGCVFLKLQEYRMSKAEESNSELKHITVLEEAHNLLRRTSVDQSQEGANLQGKSVEMISNAIAEMRTYGEGFIIADQAPGLLDQSVIRNTNTKIIHRLPDWEDRELVGKAANLKDEQLEELARLGTGCAAVYQNNWQEAVLCQVDKFSRKLEPFKRKDQGIDPGPDSRKKARTELIRILIEARMSKREVCEVVKEMKSELNAFAPYFPKVVKGLHDRKIDGEWLLVYVREALQFEEAAKEAPKGNPDQWTKALLKNIFSQLIVPEEDRRLREQIIQSVFEILSREKPNDKERWMEWGELSAKWNEVV